MHYHLIIETKEKKKDEFITHYLLDVTDINLIKEKFIRPYISGNKFLINGYSLQESDVRRFLVKQSEHNTAFLVEKAYQDLPSNVLMIFHNKDMLRNEKNAKDITDALLSEAKKFSETNSLKPVPLKVENNKVFVVHGRDDLLKTETARFLEQLGLNPIILHEQANGGKTIIEKIEANTDVGFGVVLYTPCDEGRLEGEKSFKARARQNVVFEHGYLIGKLGRNKVAALVKNNVEIPNDISGLVYIQANDQTWQFHLAKDLREAGFKIDLNKL